MANVTKKEIVEEISRRTGMTQAETKVVFESLLEAIAQSLRAGRNIELRGFGRFKVRARQARTARNPRTGEVVEVPGGLKPVFEASRELRELLNAPDHDLATLQTAIGKAFPTEVLVESGSETE
jgi:nucleoid DNA-binding protein